MAAPRLKYSRLLNGTRTSALHSATSDTVGHHIEQVDLAHALDPTHLALMALAGTLIPVNFKAHLPVRSQRSSIRKVRTLFGAIAEIERAPRVGAGAPSEPTWVREKVRH
jgi:hypothetical protein